jgi:hypothetical protein
MTWFFALLDWLNAVLNTPILSGAAGLVGVTGGRTLVFLVTLVCSIGVVLQSRRVGPRLRALVRVEQTVSLPADQLMRLIGVFLGLIVLAALVFGVQASSTYYAVQARMVGYRDVVTSLTLATLIFHIIVIGLALTVARLAVVIADVLTGERRPHRERAWFSKPALRSRA